MQAYATTKQKIKLTWPNVASAALIRRLILKNIINFKSGSYYSAVLIRKLGFACLSLVGNQ